jgi:hypothetical protein
VGQTASGRSDKDTGLDGYEVGCTVGDGWLGKGKGKEGGWGGEWWARRVDKQRPSQVRLGHSGRDGMLRTSGRFREGARISGEERHESTFITGRRDAAASLVFGD